MCNAEEVAMNSDIVANHQFLLSRIGGNGAGIVTPLNQNKQIKTIDKSKHNNNNNKYYLNHSNIKKIEPQSMAPPKANNNNNHNNSILNSVSQSQSQSHPSQSHGGIGMSENDDCGKSRAYRFLTDFNSIDMTKPENQKLNLRILDTMDQNARKGSSHRKQPPSQYKLKSMATIVMIIIKIQVQ